MAFWLVAPGDEVMDSRAERGTGTVRGIGMAIKTRPLQPRAQPALDSRRPSRWQQRRVGVVSVLGPAGACWGLSQQPGVACNRDLEHGLHGKTPAGPPDSTQ